MNDYGKPGGVGPAGLPGDCGDDEEHEQHATLNWTAEGGQETGLCLGRRGPHMREGWDLSPAWHPSQAVGVFHYSPDPRELMHNPGGAQCPVMDGAYRCTMVLGHAGDDHHTWSTARGRMNREWRLVVDRPSHGGP